MVKYYAFRHNNGELDIDSISESPDGVRLDMLESSMGWRFRFPDRYSHAEKWNELLGFGKVVEVEVNEVAESDDDEPITSDWVASNFPSMGPQYSARQRSDIPCLTWVNRFERFTLHDVPQTHLKTRGDVRRLVAALGKSIPLDRPPRAEDREGEWL